MRNDSPIFLRAHTQVVKLPTNRRAKTEKTKPNPDAPKAAKQPRWPEYVLVFDCETTIDACQALTFGAYQFCRAFADQYECLEEGLFYADELPETDPAGLEVLKHYARTMRGDTMFGDQNQIGAISRSEFVERGLWLSGACAGALIVGFNLPFDVSRLAIDNRDARHRNETWSLVMFQDKCPETGRPRENPFRPRVIVTPKDSKAAFIRFAGVSKRSKKSKKRLVPYAPGRFLDLRTLGWALRNESYSLQRACEAFAVPGKLDHQPTGQITHDEIDYCRQDIRSTVALLNAMRAEFDQHPIELQPERAYSPASIAKAYLKAMGLVPPSEKFDIPGWALGAAMQAYYGGRAECRIRHTVVPVVHTDFMSEYPTVNTLLGLWSYLRAQALKIEEATEDVKRLLAEVTPETVFDPDTWKRFAFFALVHPAGDILPVRMLYNGETSNIGVNPLTSPDPVWYAGPDLVAAKLLSGKNPEVIRVFRIVPYGQQAGLKPTTLQGKIAIDPGKDDFFQTVIEARALVKADETMPKDQRDSLSYFLKILANAGSYGLFVEINPERVGTDAKTGKPARAKVKVFSGETTFEQTSPVVEQPGAWYCPLFGALITAGGRLLLALLERVVTDAGGNYLLCDTDSMAIVASEHGGLVSCVGGRLVSDGCEAIKALSWADVENIVARFKDLNPYGRNAVRGSILKIEDVNFKTDKTQRLLNGYAIAAKRYALFTRTPDGDIRVEKPSAHGLGFLYPPKSGFNDSADEPVWVVEAWEWALRQHLGLPQVTPPWLRLPAMMRFTVTTPEVLKVLQARQRKLPYRQRTKPFNFILSPIMDPLTGGNPVGTDASRFTLVGLFSSNPEDWYRFPYVNVHDGKSYMIGRPGTRLPYQAEPKTYGGVIGQYRWHPEAKSLAPDGGRCTPDTGGLLRRTPVAAGGFRYIGKETDRRWEQGEDFSMLDPHVMEYHANETARLVTDPILQRKARTTSIRALAKEARVSEKTVKAARKGLRLRKSTVDKLMMTLKAAGSKMSDPDRNQHSRATSKWGKDDT